MFVLVGTTAATVADVVSAPLNAALTDCGNPVPRSLPTVVEQLLISLNAPPRLAAHLRIVHDVATELAGMLTERYPMLAFDREAVRYGAATHDIGKVLHTDELSGPGAAHEPAGYALLRSRNVPEQLARFARTHADWARPDIRLEDLLVSLADNVWKAKRVAGLEDRVVAQLTATTGEAAWQGFMDLDDVLTQIAGRADDRLAFQARYSITAAAR